MLKTFLLPILLLVSFPTLAAEIDIDSHNHNLTYHNDFGSTENYEIAVGRRGTNVHGVFVVERKALHPSWTPTPNMLKGRTAYTVPPGKNNPLGIAKLYLSGPEKYIGIHGTNDERSIGKDVSHGCFRLHKSDILKLYHEVPVGTKVIVR